MLLKNNIFRFNGKEIKIAVLADLHIGNNSANMRLIKAFIKEILKTKNCYAICIGDLLDLVTYSSKGLLHEQKLLATEQVMAVIDLLRPISHKILFMSGGNHEKRLIHDAALNLTRLIAKELNVDYMPSEAYFGISFKEGMLLRCYANHNCGGGSTAGAKINRLINLHWRACEADVIFGAHSHDMADTQKLIIYMDTAGNKRKRIQQFVVAGSALEGDSGYPADMVLAPIPIGLKIVTVKRSWDVECDRWKFAYKIDIIQL